ncbi:glutaredoxin domain-containing protein [Bradyrhizobium sp. STM 3562]|uniref:glutaredoxin domain-containing protein n=1 Tax=Bradyrhizobium sp. STM 3562 TaxID=578924 RepID=UPI0038906FDF
MTATTTPEIKVFWQPGCTSCLRTKEFLTRHNVPFVSVNVLEEGFEELERFGLQQVPIVVRGDEWVNGQVLADVARIAGIELRHFIELPPADLFARLCRVQQAARRYLQQLPDDSLDRLLPNRPRSYADLVYHIFNIADALLEHERGIPLIWDSYNRVPEPGKGTKAALTAYGDEVFEGLQHWWNESGSRKDFTQSAQVYYGTQNLREFLERTTWHSGQHTRQLMMVLEMMGIAPEKPLGAETFAGLPMPEKVWDDEKAAA